MKLHGTLKYKNEHTWYILLLLVICLVSYWPLTFSVFSSKGDSIQYFLPYRYTISCAIQQGEFPFWSPYVYLGNPVYGDMQSGSWNPFVWFFSLFGTYTMDVFHIEYMVYIFLAAVGMYKLIYYLYKNAPTALIIAASYMLSGFILGGQLINWAAAAAFIPFIIYYYLVLTREYKWSAACKLGISLYLLFVCGYPSFFIIISYILAGLFIITVIDRIRKKENTTRVSWGRFGLLHILVVLIFTGLVLPAIISYFDLLPYYTRGGGVSYAESNANSFEWQHFITFFFPATGGAPYSYSETDMTSRNIYFGFMSLLIFTAFPPKLNRRNILLILLVIFSALFSLGDATPVRKLCYDLLPLMDTFRHPAQMRLFMLIGLLLLMAPGMQKFIASVVNKNDQGRYHLIKITSIALILFFIVVIALSFNKTTIFKTGHNLGNGFNAFIKKIIDTYRFYDAIFISAIVQLGCILLFTFWFIKKKLSVKKFYWLWIINLFVLAQLVLPITFVSQTNPKLMNSFIHENRNQFPADRLNLPLIENSRDVSSIYDRGQLELGLSNFYKRTISITHVTYSPSFLSELDPVFSNEALYNYIASKPAVYIADSVINTKDSSLLINNSAGNFVISDEFAQLKDSVKKASTATIKKLGSNRIEISTKSERDAYLVLTQSYHHHWKAWIDHKKETINKVNAGFMGIKLPAGEHTVIFKFVPTNTINAIWVMIATLLGLIIAAILSFYRRKKNQATA